jgi:phosphoenolpyruvate synthase/pyruvate phosphate dikinase
MSTYAKEKIANLLKTQQSLTEWFEDVNHADVDKLKIEDNDKRVRLQKLGDLINLPHETTYSFTARDLDDQTETLKLHIDQHGDELCALRLIPLKKGLPKLRTRGITVIEAYEWYKAQDINPDDYRADYIEHPPDNSWSTIFVVTDNGIFGEIVWGGHQQLTQGFHDDGQPTVFTYDFNEWKLSKNDNKVLEYLKSLIEFIHVDGSERQDEVKKELNASFSNNYIKGYFETADSSIGLWFIDYNQSLGEAFKSVDIENLITENVEKSLVAGMKASLGAAEGAVVIVPADNLNIDFVEGSVLVCHMTSPDYLPIMKKSSAIVTDQGGILSHAAIIARELGIPCIVGTQDATTVLKNGDIVRVDANKGAVFAIS